MSDTTPRLALPLIAAGQAQKDLFHNEALVRLDAAALATVEEVGLDAPPAGAADGACWIVGGAPVGDWAGRARAIAIRTAGGWRFLPPVAGMTLHRVRDGMAARFDGGAWTVGDAVAERLLVGGVQVVGARRPAIPRATGGAVVDTEAREALSRILAVLESHGLTAA